MSIDEIKKYMKAKKITYQMLSNMSNIPITTLKDIFRGATQNPRIDTMSAIENALGLNEKTTDNTVAKIISDLSDAGLTIEKYNNMTEEHRADFLQLVKILAKNKK